MKFFLLIILNITVLWVRSGGPYPLIASAHSAAEKKHMSFKEKRTAKKEQKKKNAEYLKTYESKPQRTYTYTDEQWKKLDDWKKTINSGEQYKKYAATSEGKKSANDVKNSIHEWTNCKESTASKEYQEKFDKATKSMCDFDNKANYEEVKKLYESESLDDFLFMTNSESWRDTVEGGSSERAASIVSGYYDVDLDMLYDFGAYSQILNSIDSTGKLTEECRKNYNRMWD